MDVINEETLTNQIQKDFEEVYNFGTVYKYTDFSTAIDHIIARNTLKFTNPREFNDPFDCNEKIISIAPMSDEQMAKIIDESAIINGYFNKEFLHLNKEELIRRLKIKERIQSLWRKGFGHYRVSCFSKVIDEPLMWAHYADKHKGVAVGFKFPCEQKNFKFPHEYKDFGIYPVHHLKEMRSIDGQLSVEKVLYYWLTTKSHHWEHEKEVRAISNNGKEIISFQKEWLTEIVFGCQVSDKDISKSISLIRNKFKYKNILIRKMSIESKTFSLKDDIIADIGKSSSDCPLVPSLN